MVRRSCVCCPKGYLAPFMDTMGIWSLCSNTCGRNWRLYPTALRMAVYHLGRREEPYLFEQSTLLLVKTHGLGPAGPHFLTQKSFTEGLWLGLAILWWLVNLLEDPNDDSNNTHMDGDASRCLWALYYGRRPDLISLGCIHLLVPLNCAWDAPSDGPYNAADVVNLLKTSVRKGDTEEDVEWRSVMHWASTGQPLFQQESPDQAGDADTNESEVEEVPDPQTPKPKGRNTDKQRQKEQGKAERKLRKQEEAREKQRKKEEKEKEKKAKEDERANRKRKEEEDKLATAAGGASPSQKKRAVRGLAGHPATWCPGWLVQEQRQEQWQVTGGPTYRWIMTVAGPYRTYNHRRNRVSVLVL